MSLADLGFMHVGDPAEHAARILLTDDPATDAEALERRFEQFMQSAEGWPEATGIRESFEMRLVAAKVAIPQLEIAANSDPITSRCFFCST